MSSYTYYNNSKQEAGNILLLTKPGYYGSFLTGGGEVLRGMGTYGCFFEGIGRSNGSSQGRATEREADANVRVLPTDRAVRPGPAR
jgi:hypothetical protein